MKKSSRSSPAQLQYASLRRPGATQFVDIHCHCVPGLDDGPKTLGDAVTLCRALVADGMTSVVATPHQLGRYDGRNEAGEVRQAVSSLNETLRKESVPLTVLPGADVRVDERIPQMLRSDRVLTLADGGRHILLELPHDTFVDLAPLLADLARSSVTAIISHPERNGFIGRHVDAVRPWLAHGACLQVTAASLLGGFGPTAEKMGWEFLASGAPALVATDAHDSTGRPPCMSDAFDLITRRMGRSVAEQACSKNPRRVLNGERIAPVLNLAQGEVR